MRAKGGPVKGGSPYIVGEKGPELFVPGSSGNVVPNHEMGGANIVVNVDASGSEVEGNQGQAAELGRMLGAAIQAELIKEKRPGGLLAGR
jgi:phage-related minor tail protein